MVLRHPPDPASQTAAVLPHGHGTILLVEDEPELRALVHEVLTESGYRVIPTAGPVDALRLARATAEPIHLLLTDIVMPDMNGLALAERLRVDRPEMKVLYMTGYSNDIVMAHGTPDEGAMIEKPFSPRVVVARVREMLGGRV